MKKNLLVLVVIFTLAMTVMAGCGKPTLSEWVAESDEIAAGEEESNAALADAGLGLRIKYSADGEDVLVLSYIQEEYQTLSGYSQREMETMFVDELNFLGVSARIPSLFDACEEETGIILKCIRVQCVNADGTVIYSQDYYDTK